MLDYTDAIRQAIARNDYLITHHARQQKGRRKITDQEIIRTVLNGEVIEQNPQAKPHPKCLFMHPVRPDEPLYVACGYDGRRAHVITVHWRDPDKWTDWRTRRS